jgi:type VI secretion system protein ImpE
MSIPVSSKESPQDLLRAGRVEDCLKAVEDAVRKAPADAKQRVLLFQVLSVLGHWERAHNQLEVCASLNDMASLMSQMYRQAIACERVREDVFRGKRTPLILGEPAAWMGMIVQAAMHTANGKHEAAQALRDQAFELAPAVAGEMDIGPVHARDAQANNVAPPSGAVSSISDRPAKVPASARAVTTHAIEWIADADPRLGPMFEAIVEGKYYWVPFERVKLLRIEPPEDLRDCVWMPAQIVWTAGAEQVALIPARYPGSQNSPDGLIKLGRKTEFVDQGGEELPLGQRLLATDVGEFSIMDVRAVRLGNQDDLPAMEPEDNADGADRADGASASA